MYRLFLFFKRRVTGSYGAQMQDFSKFNGRIVPFRGMDDDVMEDCNSQSLILSHLSCFSKKSLIFVKI